MRVKYGYRFTYKACRQKYMEKLRPGLKFGVFYPWEDAILAQARKEGYSFAQISRKHLPHRSERALVNRVRSPGFITTQNKLAAAAEEEELTKAQACVNEILKEAAMLHFDTTPYEGSGEQRIFEDVIMVS